MLGADDFHDSALSVIDSPLASVMGVSRGTNNQGFPPTSTTPATSPGNLSSITPCDVATIKDAQTSPYALSGGPPPNPNMDLPWDYSGSTGGVYVYTFAVESRIIY